MLGAVLCLDLCQLCQGLKLQACNLLTALYGGEFGGEGGSDGGITQFYYLYLILFKFP